MSADLPTATILPPSTAIAASRMMRRLGSMVISHAMSAMTRSTDCTGAPRSGTAGVSPARRERDAGGTPAVPGTLFILPHISEFVRDLQFDQHIFIGGIFAQHRAVADALGDEQHVAGMHDLDAHFGFPLQRALDAENDLVGIDVAMPEAHIVLAALGDVDLDPVRGVEPQRRAVRFDDIGGAEFLGEDVDHPK